MKQTIIHVGWWKFHFSTIIFIRINRFLFFTGCTSGNTQADDASIMLWRTFSMVPLGLFLVVEQTIKLSDYLDIFVNELYPFTTTSVFPTGTRVSSRIILQRFEMAWNGGSELKHHHVGTKHGEIVFPVVEHLVHSISCHPPRTCGTNANASCSKF